MTTKQYIPRLLQNVIPRHNHKYRKRTVLNNFTTTIIVMKSLPESFPIVYALSIITLLLS